MSRDGKRHNVVPIDRDATPERRTSNPDVKGDAQGERYHAGQVIASKYRLERVLGRGGMGAVWLARNLTLDVDVAIKLVRRDVTAPEASERLLREARAAARLEHPSIVRVYDFGETEHRDPFIVMEVVRGESLADVIDRKGRVSATTAVQMLLPIVDALAVAHGRGIIHRDVKPDNIILMAGDKGTINPKLVDFGIAKDAPHDWSAGPIAVAPAGARNRRLTQVGAIVGSPDYMSPEQASGSSHVDHASDVWALCVVLYESICGVRPFAGEDLGTLAVAIMGKKPTPIGEHGAGDQALWHIIQRGLDKDSQKRWPSMRAMGCELAAWLADNEVVTDITGAALEAHWLSNHSLRPFSDAPAATVPSAPVSAPEAPQRPQRPARTVVAAVALACVALLTSAALLVAFIAGREQTTAPAADSPSADAPPATPSAAPSLPTAAPASSAPSAAPEDPRPTPTPSASTTAAAPTASASSDEPPRHAPKRQQAAPSDPGF